MTATSAVDGRCMNANSSILRARLAASLRFLVGLGEQHAVFAQHRAQRLGVVGVAVAFDRLAGRNLNSAVLEDGHGSTPHESTTTSSCVAATTSSTVVRPIEHLARAVVAQRIHALRSGRRA